MRQEAINDCGPACLRYIAAKSGKKIPSVELRVRSGTHGLGTTLAGLVDAAQQYGMDAKVMKGSPADMVLLPPCTILLLNRSDGTNHFVVLERFRATEGVARIWDPLIGKCFEFTSEKLRETWGGYSVWVRSQQFSRKPDGKKTIGLRALLSPYLSHYLEAFLGALLVAVLGFALTIYVRHIMDDVLPNQNWQSLNLGALIVLAILALRAWITQYNAELIGKIGRAVASQITVLAQDHVLRLEQSVIDAIPAGELLGRLRELAQVRALLGEMLVRIVVNIMLLVLTILFLTYISPKIALVFSVAVLVVSALRFWADIRAANDQEKLINVNRVFETKLAEAIHQMDTVKRMNLERYTCGKLVAAFAREQSIAEQIADQDASRNAFGEFFARSATLLVLWVAATEALQSRLTAGDVMSCFILASLASGPIATLASALGSARIIRAALRHVSELLISPAESDEKPAFRLAGGIGSIAVENVSFAFASRAPLFDSVSASFKAGTVNVITGPSGSGKSTLLALLHRLYPLTTGNIRVDHHELSQIPRAELRRAIGYVPQRVELLGGALADNICLDDPNPDMSRAENLCLDLGLSELLKPGGPSLRLHIMEGGRNVSAGQRQRIGLARALYRQPRTLCIDEPETALDDFSVRKVQAILQRFRDSGGLVILASHDERFISMADVHWKIADKKLCLVAPRSSEPHAVGRSAAIADAGNGNAL